MSWIVDLDSVDENFECPIFEMPSKSSTVVEPCTECKINEDCGDWDVNHMKCEKSKCICGQNWLIGKNRRCNKLNSKAREGNVFEEFTVDQCKNFLTCNMELEYCLEDCGNDSACTSACLRNHADCESNYP